MNEKVSCKLCGKIRPAFACQSCYDNETAALETQRADLLAALKALTEDSEIMVREYPCSPKLHLIDDARAAIKKAEEL